MSQKDIIYTLWHTKFGDWVKHQNRPQFGHKRHSRDIKSFIVLLRTGPPFTPNAPASHVRESRSSLSVQPTEIISLSTHRSRKLPLHGMHPWKSSRCYVIIFRYINFDMDGWRTRVGTLCSASLSRDVFTFTELSCFDREFYSHSHYQREWPHRHLLLSCTCDHSLIIDWNIDYWSNHNRGAACLVIRFCSNCKRSSNWPWAYDTTQRSLTVTNDVQK